MCNVSDDLPSHPYEEPDAADAKADIEEKEYSSARSENPLFTEGLVETEAVMRSRLRRKVDDIPVEIEVVIGRTKVSVADLMRVGPGHKFRLDRRFGEPIELIVNGRLIGYGEIVADRDDHVVGVRLIRIASEGNV